MLEYIGEDVIHNFCLYNFINKSLFEYLHCFIDKRNKKFMDSGYS